VEAAEVALTATIVLQEQYAITQHKLHVVSETAARHAENPRPMDHDFRAHVLRIGILDPVLPNLLADFTVHWEGNNYGEMGAAYVSVDPKHTEFLLSSLDVSFRPLQNLPRRGDDSRLWPMQWLYEGNFDPFGRGEWEFQGRFEIDAFGAFRNLEHLVTDRSMIRFSAPAESYVRPGPEVPGLTPPPLRQ